MEKLRKMDRKYPWILIWKDKYVLPWNLRSSFLASTVMERDFYHFQFSENISAFSVDQNKTRFRSFSVSKVAKISVHDCTLMQGEFVVPWKKPMTRLIYINEVYLLCEFSQAWKILLQVEQSKILITDVCLSLPFGAFWYSG